METFLSNPQDIALSDEHHSLSYMEFCRRVEFCGEKLRKYRVKSVAIQGVNSIDNLLILLGAITAGLRIMPVNPGFKELYLKGLLNTNEVELLVWNRDLGLDIPILTPEMVLEGDPGLMLPPEDCSKDSRIVILTSGTTAGGKGVVHKFENFIKSGLASNSNIPVQKGDSWAMTLPLFHVGGLGIIFRTLLGGGRVVLPGKRSMEELLSCENITHISLVPTQLQRLLNSSAGVNDGFRGLKAVLLGGAPSDEALLLQSVSAGVPVYKTYGMTEAASQITSSREPICRARIQGSGYPLEGVDLKLEGNLIGIKCPWLFETYTSGDRGSFRDGWFFTGDTGFINDNGELQVTGRVDNMFVCGGENIYPEEIELQIKVLTEVEDLVVTSIPDEEYGERPVVFIKWSGKVDIKSFEQWMKDNISGIKRPVAVFSWPEDYLNVGLKRDRNFFKQLAQNLNQGF